VVASSSCVWRLTSRFQQVPGVRVRVAAERAMFGRRRLFAPNAWGRSGRRSLRRTNAKKRNAGLAQLLATADNMIVECVRPVLSFAYHVEGFVSESGFLKGPIVKCPECQKAMTPSEPTQVLFSVGLSDVTYKCRACGISMTGMIKKDR
jgi:hypothetical protein